MARSAIYALFSDLEGFTILSRSDRRREMVAFLAQPLSRLCCRETRPRIWRDDRQVRRRRDRRLLGRADQPARRRRPRGQIAAIAMYEAGEQFRRGSGLRRRAADRRHPGRLPSRRRDRRQFRRRGPHPVHRARRLDEHRSRLEGANKYLKTKTLVSDTVVEKSTYGLSRPMGRIAVSGRSTPMIIFEPVPHCFYGSKTVHRHAP